jgi:hypothetical protein
MIMKWDINSRGAPIAQDPRALRSNGLTPMVPRTVRLRKGRRRDSLVVPAPSAIQNRPA